MLVKVLCLLLSCLFAVEAQFFIHRGERDVFRNLTGCSTEAKDFCYYRHAEESPLDPCVCRCMPKYPMYRNPDVYLSRGGDFMSKGKPACVWHSNHRYECFHIRKLGRGFNTSDDEGALEFDFRKPGSLFAFADHDISRCSGLDTAIKMPDDDDFKPKTGLLTASYGRFDVINFQWTKIAEKYDGGILRGVFQDCRGNIAEAGRCFVGKISGIYSGGECSVRALNGECCILPFTYKGQVYNSCTTVDSEDSWCAVSLPFFGNETNWWRLCTNTSKINVSLSTVIQSSLTTNASHTSRMILPTEVVSFKNSSLHHGSTSMPTASVEKPVVGPLPVGPGPPLQTTRLVSEGAFSTVVRGSILPYKISTETSKVLPTTIVPSVSPYKLSPSSSSYQTLSISNYNESMVDYKSSVSHEPTPSEIKVTATNFTSSVSDQKSSIKVSMSDHASSIIDHVLSETVAPKQSIDYSRSTSDYKPSDLSLVLSMSDHQSAVSDYIRSISNNQTVFSGTEQTMSTTSQYTYEHKPSFTRSMSSQIATTAPSTVMNSSVSSVTWPSHKATESDLSTTAVIIVIVMAAVAFLAISLLCLFFLFLKHRKNRNKAYGLIHKKSGNQVAQSPDSQRADNQNQNDMAVVEDTESEMAETEFTIPEKNNHETSDTTNNKDYEPAYMTFRL